MSDGAALKLGDQRGHAVPLQDIASKGEIPGVGQLEGLMSQSPEGKPVLPILLFPHESGTVKS